MTIKFTKMHGLGNDFMVVDAIRQNLLVAIEQIRQWANRRTGIGFDQLLIAEPARHPQADFFYRIFNADGSEAANCGNGARCLARFLQDEKLTDKNPIIVETLSGLLELTLEKDGQVTVNMGVPVLAPAQIPFTAEKQALQYSLKINDQMVPFCAISLGNPHAVILVEDVETAPVQAVGAFLTKHPAFPQGVNVGFMQIINANYVRLRVYERGVGETLACGSGACAAMVTGRLLEKLNHTVTVQQSGGELTVCWQALDQPIYLTGPAVKVFIGHI